MDYVHWPMNDAAGVTPAKIQTVTFPDITFSGTTAGMWSNAGWLTGSGDLEGSTGDDADVKDFFNLDNIGDGMIIVAGWIKSPDFSTADDNVMWSYGVAASGAGFVASLERHIIAGDEPDLTRVRVKANFQSTKDLRPLERENTNGAVFVMEVLRNQYGLVEHCVPIDGIQTSGTSLKNNPWSTTGTQVEKGFTIGAERDASGVFSEFWRDGDMIKDLIIVRSSNDAWIDIDVLCRDAWKARGGIPQSWFDTL